MTSSGEEGATAAEAPRIEPRGGKLLVGVRVIPAAQRTEVRGLYGDRLKVAVSAPPEAGKANARLVQALTAWLGLPPGSIHVELGHTGRDKVVAFSNIVEDELRDRLKELLRAAGQTKRTPHGP